MNSYFLIALLSLSLIASTSATRKQEWSGNVQMQIKRQAGATSSQCSDQAMQTLNENVSDFLRSELATLLGTEDAFSLGVVRGDANGDNLSLIASFDCFDCGTTADHKSIAQILKFFMQRRKDTWLPESDSAMTEGCVDYDASVSSVVVAKTVDVAPAQPALTILRLPMQACLAQNWTLNEGPI
jgi:hypothetical protein